MVLKITSLGEEKLKEYLVVLRKSEFLKILYNKWFIYYIYLKIKKLILYGIHVLVGISLITIPGVDDNAIALSIESGLIVEILLGPIPNSHLYFIHYKNIKFYFNNLI